MYGINLAAKLNYWIGDFQNLRMDQGSEKVLKEWAHATKQKMRVLSSKELTL